jgi:hypothetical protein
MMPVFDGHFVHRDEITWGPLDLTMVRELYRANLIDASSMCWHPTWDAEYGWVTLDIVFPDMMLDMAATITRAADAEDDLAFFIPQVLHDSGTGDDHALAAAPSCSCTETVEEQPPACAWPELYARVWMPLQSGNGELELHRGTLIDKIKGSNTGGAEVVDGLSVLFDVGKVYTFKCTAELVQSWMSGDSKIGLVGDDDISKNPRALAPIHQPSGQRQLEAILTGPLKMCGPNFKLMEGVVPVSELPIGSVRVTERMRSGSCCYALDCFAKFAILLFFLEGKVDATNVRRFAVLNSADPAEEDLILFSRMFTNNANQHGSRSFMLQVAKQPRPAHASEIWLEQRRAAATSLLTSMACLTPASLHKRLSDKHRGKESVTSLSIMNAEQIARSTKPVSSCYLLRGANSSRDGSSSTRDATRETKGKTKDPAASNSRSWHGTGGRGAGKRQPGAEVTPFQTNFELEMVGPVALGRVKLVQLQALCSERQISTKAAPAEQLIQLLWEWKKKRKAIDLDSDDADSSEDGECLGERKRRHRQELDDEVKPEMKPTAQNQKIQRLQSQLAQAKMLNQRLQHQQEEHAQLQLQAQLESARELNRLLEQQQQQGAAKQQQQLQHRQQQLQSPPAAGASPSSPLLYQRIKQMLQP